jgi:4a-hydroxytetrahydrobiopterin dehydratase
MHPTVIALTPAEIQNRLQELPQWRYQNNALERVEKFPTYRRALDFVYRVGEAAEANDHHPDMRIDFKTVTVRYWTHSVGGVSDLDFKMALAVEKLIVV